MTNSWHDIHYGDDCPKVVNCVIEIPKASKGKFELDKVSGMLKLDRVLFSAVHYPANYGFIPKTYCEDKDPLDILVISSIEIPHFCLLEAKVIGVMRMRDQGEADDKIIAVANNDVSVNHVKEIEELPPHTLKEIRRFFEDYKKLENKESLVEDFLGRKKAYKIIEESVRMYKEVIEPGLRK